MFQANKLGAFGILVFDALETALDGLSPSAASMLLKLYDRPSLTITELAAIAGIAQSTAVRVLDGLTRQGWLERQSRIGRTTPLLLTEAGAARVRKLQTARLDIMNGLLATLPEAERVVFERALDTMLTAATTSRAFARTTCRLCDHSICDEPHCPIGNRATELERQSANRSGNETEC